VSWKVYAAGSFREGCINWTSSHAGVSNTTGLFDDIMNNTLPQVAFIDGPDDHPPANIQVAEAFARRLYVALRGSPAWATSALVMSYDEAGGFFDHVPPPSACRPDGTLANSDFNRLGIRVPLVVISPWARPHYASHVRAETASITRLIEALHDLPALTNRDANVSALLDLFDFSAPHLMSPPTAPAAGTGGCP
jgi:phospholipase C